ncbi:MAG: DUF1501 domain-containing protein, partial [Pirellulaceae bacterium]
MNPMQNLSDLAVAQMKRRWFLAQCGVGLGGLAARSLLADEGASSTPMEDLPMPPKPSHYEAKAKRVIFLFQAGAPSHLELFDPKPELTKRNGQLPPPELLEGYRAAFINPKSALLGP